MQKISPFLWFNGQLGQAIDFYTGIFKNSKITNVQQLNGKIFTAVIELEGQEFMALDWAGGEPFTNAVSFFVKCENQREVDHYWEKLTANGGHELKCGWLTDKFGVTWQIIPNKLGQLMNDPDRAKAQRVMQAMMQMVKLDIAGLEAAYAEE